MDSFSGFLCNGVKADKLFWLAAFTGPITPRLAVAWARAEHYPREVTPIMGRWLGIPYISGYRVSPP